MPVSIDFTLLVEVTKYERGASGTLHSQEHEVRAVLVPCDESFCIPVPYFLFR